MEEVWGWEEWITYARYICVKPEEAPPGKDNDYGYGMPYGDLLLRQLQPAYAAMLPDMTGIIGVAMLGMLGIK